MNELLSVDQVAQRLKISYRKASDLIKAKQIRGKKVGRSWRVSEIDLLQYITTTED